MGPIWDVMMDWIVGSWSVEGRRTSGGSVRMMVPRVIGEVAMAPIPPWLSRVSLYTLGILVVVVDIVYL